MSELLHRLRARAAAAADTPVYRDDLGAIAAGRLLRRVGALARRLRAARDPVGILLPNAIDWVVADLACKWAGKTAVPLPDFFSAAQLAHVGRDAGVATTITDAALAPRAAALGAAVLVADAAEADPPEPSQSWRMIVYSSGSTGTPRGVLLAERQLAHSARALARATAATQDDRYLSVMPMALLLEQLSAIHLPILVGGSAALSARLTWRALAGDGEALADAVEAVRPSVMSLVPHLLRVWLAALARPGREPVGSLRLVAVGGAPVPPALARDAWRLGVPVHEGYGLTECCAVVALNRPGARVEGSVGRPLDGLAVDLVDGEIVVSGPTVMERYLRGDAPDGRWATGDLGEFDAAGNLVVRGRKDAVIRTSLGRNINPEWIEEMILRDARVRRCAVLGDGLPWPVALIELSPLGRAWRDAGGVAEALIAELAGEAPDYARPRRIVLLDEGELGNPALATPNGRPRRAAIARRFAGLVRHDGSAASGAGSPAAEHGIAGYEGLLRETAAERRVFLEIPVIRRAVAEGVSRDLYVAFLGQAYHHVRQTCPLLQEAAARCDRAHDWLRHALLHYIEEENGHDAWILDDIAAMGGDAAAVRDGEPGRACRAMVAHAYDAIRERGPFALLGMVHVLEGMSVLLAEQAAASIRRSMGAEGAAGFRYLTSHGALDIEHVGFFRSLVDRVSDASHARAIVDTAKAIYRLYGDIFRELDAGAGPTREKAPGEGRHHAA